MLFFLSYFFFFIKQTLNLLIFLCARVNFVSLHFTFVASAVTIRILSRASCVLTLNLHKENIYTEMHKFVRSVGCVWLCLCIAAAAGQYAGENELSSSGPADETIMVNRDGAERQVGWLERAKSALVGPAGQVMVHVAKEMISRSAGNSQVRHKESELKTILNKKYFFSFRRFSV